jgi:hypothetical protein
MIARGGTIPRKWHGFMNRDIAEGKKPVLVSVEAPWVRGAAVTMQAVDSVTRKNASAFLAFQVKPGQNVRTDDLPALNAVSIKHIHEREITSPEQAAEWLPLVHIMIGNMKKFLSRIKLAPIETGADQ